MKKLIFWMCVMATSMAPPTKAAPQSMGLSEASVASVQAMKSAASAMLKIVPAGSELVVQSIAVTGKAASVTLKSTHLSGVIVIEVATEVVEKSGLVLGGGVTVVASSMGWALEKAGELLCFVPNEKAQRHSHRRVLSHAH